MSKRIGVIGVGPMGLTHVHLLSHSVSGAEVVAMSAAHPEAAERAAAEAGVSRVHADGVDLIHDEQIDAIVVASPAETHEAFVTECVAAGKPVLCEKPLASTADATRRLLDAEIASGRRLVQVGFMRRFDAAYAELKAKLDSGLVGRPVLVHCAHRNPVVPATFSSEMTITDGVVHEMDTLRWLLGQELVRVTVLVPSPSSYAREGLRDPQLVIFETDGGAIADVEAFVNARYAYDIRCEVVGELGTVSLPSAALTDVRRDGGITAVLPPGSQGRFRAAFLNELLTWIASIAEGEARGPSAWDGHVAARVCEAGVAALHSGSPVDISIEQRPDFYGDGVGRPADRR
jgi:myo-inositol 2-dehydrogenase/D-chiro-inositol 1-dehydrogenase